ncbi:MAG: excinuclease ABC subunit UvrC [Candidatus Woesearchaeota archaeon]
MKKLPKKPGVYLFKDSKDKIIYVGKAKDLQKRVSSYFSDKVQSPKTKVLAKQIKNTDYFITNNEVEALLLENKLIKEHSPKYNINLKDDKTYAYIKITDEKFPRIISTRRITKKGDYFGPYPDGYKRSLIVKILNKHFKLCTKNCMNSKSTLSYDIGLCCGACIGKESQKDYLERIKKAKEALKGSITSLENEAKKNLKKYIDLQQYELAKQEKEVLDSIQILSLKQQVDEIKNINQDVVAILKTKNYSYFSILHIKKGTILNKENFKLENEDLIFSKFLSGYYYQNEIPHEIIVSEDFWQDKKEKEILENYLESLAKRKITITHPLKGDKKKLIELAIKNLDNSDEAILKLLKEKLNLDVIPKKIECFDVSNLKNNFIVAGMTSFVNAKPYKQGYRRFKIKSKQTQDDFAAINEVVGRRYNKLSKEELPDLVVIDGGLGQLKAAKQALNTLNLDLEIISLAKQEEEIYVKEEVLRLDKSKQPLLFLRRVRDETHRFAIAYNKKLRSMSLKKDF